MFDVLRQIAEGPKHISAAFFLETWLIYIYIYNLSELRFMFGKGWRTDSDLAELFF